MSPGRSPSGRPVNSICSNPSSIRICSTLRRPGARTIRALITPG